MKARQLVIAVVGPCAAGKTTLIAGLEAHGYSARHVAQEHSYVPDMWRKLTDPDVLIYLDVSYPVSKRRTDSSWQSITFNKQLDRLVHAREHADLLIETDELAPDQVLQVTLKYLEEMTHE